MTTTLITTTIRIRYIEGGNVCADCCTAVAAVAADGESIDAATAAAADAAVGSVHDDEHPAPHGWCHDPRHSHRYEPADPDLAKAWYEDHQDEYDASYAGVRAWLDSCSESTHGEELRS